MARSGSISSRNWRRDNERRQGNALAPPRFHRTAGRWGSGPEAPGSSKDGFAGGWPHPVSYATLRRGRPSVQGAPNRRTLDYSRLVILNDASGPGVILFRGGSYSDQEMLALLDRVLGYAARLDLDRSITVVDRNRSEERR